MENEELHEVSTGVAVEESVKAASPPIPSSLGKSRRSSMTK